MDTTLLKRFAQVIRSLSAAELDGAPSLNAKLRLVEDGKVEVCYAPFEYVNPQARVVIVGITPGRTQMVNAIKEARRQLDRGADTACVLSAAKRTGAFSGDMRPNLTAMLDAVGINRWLGINCCAELFGPANHLVQTASVLRYPVFVDGKNYHGAPNMTRNALLRDQLLTHFASDIKITSNAVFIPLGDKVLEALTFIADHGMIDKHRILEGMPHPSTANSERIAYFLGRKERTKLSAKTNPDKIEAARAFLAQRVQALA